MKVVLSISLLFLCVVNALAQHVSNSVGLPDLMVIQNRWYLAIPDERIDQSAGKVVRDQNFDISYEIYIAVEIFGHRIYV